mmetsp:Transcript_33056/g.63872  ORF Transcript_33056/g.63872 Transcript_33056/m.63872 type:complete len:203 (+) Transcript_33056:474-1082(+)
MALNFRMLISQVDPSRQRESILGPMDGFVYAPISLGQRTILTAYGLRTGCYLKVLDVGPTMEKSTSWKWSMEMVASLVHTTGSTKKHGKLRVLTTHEHLNRNPQYPKQRCSDHDVRPISYICIHYVLTAFEQGRAFKSRHILVPNWDKDWSGLRLTHSHRHDDMMCQARICHRMGWKVLHQILHQWCTLQRCTGFQEGWKRS